MFWPFTNRKFVLGWIFAEKINPLNFSGQQKTLIIFWWNLPNHQLCKLPSPKWLSFFLPKCNFYHCSAFLCQFLWRRFFYNDKSWNNKRYLCIYLQMWKVFDIWWFFYDKCKFYHSRIEFKQTCSAFFVSVSFQSLLQKNPSPNDFKSEKKNSTSLHFKEYYWSTYNGWS